MKIENPRWMNSLDAARPFSVDSNVGEWIHQSLLVDSRDFFNHSLIVFLL